MEVEVVEEEVVVGRVVDVVELEVVVGRVVEVVDVDDDVVDDVVDELVVVAGVLSSSVERTAKMISTAATATINTARPHSNGFRAGLLPVPPVPPPPPVGGGAAGGPPSPGGVVGITWVGSVVGSAPGPSTDGTAWVGSSGPGGEPGLPLGVSLMHGA